MRKMLGEKKSGKAGKKTGKNPGKNWGKSKKKTGKKLEKAGKNWEKTQEKLGKTPGITEFSAQLWAFPGFLLFPGFFPAHFAIPPPPPPLAHPGFS